MRCKKFPKKLFLPTLILSAFFMIIQANAGILKIINHSSNNIKVDVIPEPASECIPYCWKCLEQCSATNAQQIKKIAVPSDALRGNKYFAVTGTEGGFLFNGECRNLSIFKNYEISFYETFFNVSCKSKEI
ncbi:MAG: hypothetical protein BGO67_02590 [Alphaproteobacteria bacterium 41-28]|nr:MAG: hypothetical protein BGO67_02590 [Alphaproteobacteria bacterium 41-28]